MTQIQDSAVETRHSICHACHEPITITIDLSAGQRWHDVEWRHEDDSTTHEADPELRLAIDATCPSCDYPEIGYAIARSEFVCSRCRHTQEERPTS